MEQACGGPRMREQTSAPIGPPLVDSIRGGYLSHDRGAWSIVLNQPVCTRALGERPRILLLPAAYGMRMPLPARTTTLLLAATAARSDEG